MQEADTGQPHAGLGHMTLKWGLAGQRMPIASR